MNRSGLTFSAAAAMLLSLPAVATALPAAASALSPATTARAAAAHAATAQSNPAARRVGPGFAESVAVQASLVISVHGTQDRVTLTGSGKMTLGNPLVVAGRPAIPFLVDCGPLTGSSSSLGRVQVTMEGPQDAWLMENSSASPFPAEEVLPVNDHITIGALPGQTLIATANSGPAILHSSSITSFPPTNTAYDLASPAQLESVDHPGQALAALQALHVTVKPV